jgi:hypothetical protein
LINPGFALPDGAAASTCGTMRQRTQARFYENGIRFIAAITKRCDSVRSDQVLQKMPLAIRATSAQVESDLLCSSLGGRIRLAANCYPFA